MKKYILDKIKVKDIDLEKLFDKEEFINSKYFEEIILDNTKEDEDALEIINKAFLELSELFDLQDIINKVDTISNKKKSELLRKYKITIKDAKELQNRGYFILSEINNIDPFYFIEILDVKFDIRNKKDYSLKDLFEDLKNVIIFFVLTTRNLTG